MNKMESREHMNSTTSLQTLSLVELTMVTGGILIVEDDGSSDNDTTDEHDGSPEPGSGDRDIG